jgi:CO/xanthine dehydrogenase Mo-binding subunit
MTVNLDSVPCGARYTADIPLGAIAHAAIVYSTVANGRTVSIDTQAVEKAPGVVIVLTHKNMPRMKPVTWSHLHPQGQTYLPLQDDRIHYAGQPVALVVAATLDQATYAGTLIKVAYETHLPVVFDLRTAKEDAVEPPQRMWPLSSSVGDADAAIADAAIKIEQTHTMPDRHHNPMEPHVTLAVWEDDGTLTLYDSTQMVVGHEEAGLARARYSGRENKCRVRVPGRRFRRQVLVLAAHVAGRARRESGQSVGPPTAYPRADVLDGGPPGGYRPDDRSRRRA